MLRFFMHTFCSIIKTKDSTYKELSIAIRGYGFFAAVSLMRWVGEGFRKRIRLVLARKGPERCVEKSFFCCVALQEGLSPGCGADVHGADPALQDHVPDGV